MEPTDRPPGLEESVAAADRLLEQGGVDQVDLPTAEQLVSEPPTEPLGRGGVRRASGYPLRRWIAQPCGRQACSRVRVNMPVSA